MPSIDTTQLLHELCDIDSRTLAAHAGTERVSELLGQRLASLGFDLSWHDAQSPVPRGRHLLAIRNKDLPAGVVLLGHSDTVLSPADVPWQLDPQTGKVIGSGVCDMKGGLVVLVESLALALKQSQRVRESRLIVLINSSEEQSVPSFRALARDKAGDASACLCFEPAEPGEDGAQEFIVSRKAVMRIEVRCEGRAAHAGQAHAQGISAIRQLARIVEAVESLTDSASDLSVNVGLFQGGKASNQVSDHATATIDVRAFDAAVLDRAVEKIRTICTTPTVFSAADGTPAKLSITERLAYPPWPRSASTDGLAVRYVEMAQRRGQRVIPKASGGGSDASHLADLMPTIDGLGILGSGLHTLHEWADTRTINLRAQIAADLIAELCGERG
jgi:glutamate carboxypeptidase